MNFELIIWLVPLGVIAAGIASPRGGLVALAAALPLFGSPPGGPYLGALDVAVVAAICSAWRESRPRPSPLTWPVAAFAVVSLLSLLPPAYLPPSWSPSVLLHLAVALPGVESWAPVYTWRAALDLLLGVGLFLAVRRAYAGRSLTTLALGLLAGLSAMLILGLASIAGLADLNDYRPLRGAALPLRRMSSLFFLSGWLSQYIVLAAPLALAALARNRGWPRRLAIPAAALVFSSLLLTQQRGAWVTMACQLLFAAVLVARRWSRQPTRLVKATAAGLASLLIAALVVMGSVSSEPVVSRATSMESGFSARTPLWSAATEMVRHRPVSGWGLGNFSPAYDQLHPVGSPGAHRYRSSAHSLYLQVAAERGLIGLLALGLVMIAIAACLWSSLTGRDVAALALAASFAGAAVYGLVQYVFYLRNIGFLIWILVGCAAVVTRLETLAPLTRAAKILMLTAALMVPVRLFLHESTPSTTEREFGLHQVEANEAGSFRWTERFAATRLPWLGDTLVLSLANGHPAGAARPVEVTIRVDGRAVKHVTAKGGWEEQRIYLGAPKKETIVLTLASSRTFRPFSEFDDYPDMPPSMDIRSLGVATKDIRWESRDP